MRPKGRTALWLGRHHPKRKPDDGNKQDADDLAQVIDLMHRRQPARRMERRSHRLSPAIRARIMELAEQTDMHSSEIAAEVGVNPGRVSEVLQGDR